MRSLLILASLLLPGCAAPSWAVPWKSRPTTAMSDRALEGRQAAYDRSAGRRGINESNGVKTSDFIPGTATRPF
jgi:hypothetical protein